MAVIKEIPNAFRDIEVGLVAEWTAHPVTERVREEIAKGINLCDRAVLECVYQKTVVDERYLATLAGIHAAYRQVAKLLEEADEHAKAN